MQSHQPNGKCQWWHCPLWHGLSSPYILIYSLLGGLIVPVCPAVQWFIAQSAALFPNYWRHCDRHTCVWTVNYLPSMLYVLFSGYISVVGDVCVRSTVSYSVSSCLLLSVCSLSLSRALVRTLSLSFSFWIFSPADWVVFMALPLLFSRERNVRKHSKPGSVPVVSEKEKHVVTVVK